MNFLQYHPLKKISRARTGPKGHFSISWIEIEEALSKKEA